MTNIFILVMTLLLGVVVAGVVGFALLAWWAS